MPVKFISHVDEDKNGDWFIKLTDTLSKNSVICENMDQYKIKLEEYSSEYGYDIEVVWTKSKSLSPNSYADLNNKMALLQEEYKLEIDKIDQQKV